MSTTVAAVAPQLAGAEANRMLAALSPDGQDHLFAQALTLEVSPGDVLYEPGRASPWVFFPLTCVVSIVIGSSVAHPASSAATTTQQPRRGRQKHRATCDPA